VLLLLIVPSVAHGQDIEETAISADGNHVAFAFEDGSVSVFDTRTSQLISVLKGHTKSLTTLSFDATGKRLITASWNDQVKTWDIQSGKNTSSITLGEETYLAFFDQNGSVILPFKKGLARYKSVLGRLFKTATVVDFLSYSSDQKQLEKEGLSKKQIKFLEVAQKFKGFEVDEVVESFFYHRKFNLFVKVSFDDLIVWDITKKQKRHHINRKNSEDGAAFHPNKPHIFIFNNDKIERWDLQTGKKVDDATIQLEGEKIDEIKHLALSPDGKRIAASIWLESNESRVVVLDTNTYAQQFIIKPLSNTTFKSFMLPDNNTLILESYPAEQWDLDKKQLVTRYYQDRSGTLTLLEAAQSHFKPFQIRSSINGLDVTPDGSIIVTGASEPFYNNVRLNKDGHLTQIYKNQILTGYDTRVSHDGSKMATGFHGEHLMVHDTETGKKLFYLQPGGVPDGLRILKFSPDDKYLAAGSSSGAIYMIDVEAQKVIKTISILDDSGIYSLTWLPDLKLIAGSLQKIYLVDWQAGKAKILLNKGSTALDTLTQNGQLMQIAVGLNEDKLILLDSKFDKIKEFDHKGVGRVEFSANPNELIAASQFKVKRWHIETGKHVDCKGNENNLWAMAYDKNSDRIYAGGDEGRVFVWDKNCNQLGN
jgi:WD40 repeat protein